MDKEMEGLQMKRSYKEHKKNNNQNNTNNTTNNNNNNNNNNSKVIIMRTQVMPVVIGALGSVSKKLAGHLLRAIRN